MCRKEIRWYEDNILNDNKCYSNYGVDLSKYVGHFKCFKYNQKALKNTK